jgi:hypothetical protein
MSISLAMINLLLSMYESFCLLVEKMLMTELVLFINMSLVAATHMDNQNIYFLVHRGFLCSIIIVLH